MDLYKQTSPQAANWEWMSVLNSTEHTLNPGFAVLQIMAVAQGRCPEIFMRTAVWVYVYVRSENVRLCTKAYLRASVCAGVCSICTCLRERESVHINKCLSFCGLCAMTQAARMFVRVCVCLIA